MESEVVQQAETMLEARNKSIIDFETACRAGICPTCGETLTLHHKVVEHRETVGIIFKKEKIRKSMSTTIICPEGHKLIHPKGHDISDPGYLVWEGCINKGINNYWKDNYNDDEDDFGG